MQLNLESILTKASCSWTATRLRDTTNGICSSSGDNGEAETDRSTATRGGWSSRCGRWWCTSGSSRGVLIWERGTSSTRGFTRGRLRGRFCWFLLAFAQKYTQRGMAVCVGCNVPLVIEAFVVIVDRGAGAPG